jgi:predicted metal-dependent phosphotriesterase family hydrolase
MTRRHWLLLALGAGACASPRIENRAKTAGHTRRIQTVTGPVEADQLGVTLMHEHVMVDFIGADKVNSNRYDQDSVFAAVLPHLRQAHQLGCNTLVECTPSFLGRDARLLRRLSQGSGVYILTNTGYYGAAKDKHLPRHAFTETVNQLAARWTREAEHGVDDTGIKPAFMKIGVDDAPLSEVDAKLVRAAALTHRETGLPIASHTTTGLAAMQQLDLLEQAGVPPAAFIWVHAQNERDVSFHLRAAERGAWVEFDAVSPASVDRHVDIVLRMKEAGRLSHVLVSHDAGWYRVGEPGGGQFRPYDTLFTAFVPALRTARFRDDDVRQVLVDNPRRALSGEFPVSR